MKQCHLAHILDCDSNQFFTLFVCLDLIGVNELPHILKHDFAKLPKVLTELEGIQVDQAHDLSSGLNYFVGNFSELRIILLQNENSGVHYLSEIIFIEVWQLFLRDNGLYDMKSRIHDAVKLLHENFVALIVLDPGLLNTLHQEVK